jgi:CheY-like chemotaxis protein
VLDWSMPEANGLEVCQAIFGDPERRYVTPSLTAHDEDVIAASTPAPTTTLAVL